MNTTSLNGGIGSASGYENYSNLNNPFFAKDLINRYYARTIGGLICSQDILPADIKNTGDRVIFRRTPKAKIHRYTKNQILERDGLSTTTTEMLIDRALYFNLDVDDVDQHQIGAFQAWVDGFKYDAVERVAQTVDRELMDVIPMQAHRLNRGKCAGAISRSYDMGAGGSPIKITEQNILNKINQASTVLTEANVDFADRFLVLPPEALPILAGTTVLGNALNSGLPKSLQLVGTEAYDGPIGGFGNIYFSNLLPRRWDPVAQKWCYAMMFGRKDATGFVTQISKHVYTQDMPDRFSGQWKGLFVYGMKVLRPEAVGVMYGYFESTQGE